jgi:hypothetical protein
MRLGVNTAQSLGSGLHGCGRSALLVKSTLQDRGNESRVMYSIVKCLRVKGALRAAQEISGDPGFEGEMRFSRIGATSTALLIERDSEQIQAIIPMLEHAELASIHVDMMLFRGIERDMAGVGFEQEWAVRIVGSIVDAPLSTLWVGLGVEGRRR